MTLEAKIWTVILRADGFVDMIEGAPSTWVGHALHDVPGVPAELVAAADALRALPLACPRCEGRMRLLALVTEPARIARALRALGERTGRQPARQPEDPQCWKSRVLRRVADNEHAAE